jgi:hypothetical protein
MGKKNAASQKLTGRSERPSVFLIFDGKEGCGISIF